MKNRCESIQGLRLIAFLAIVVEHTEIYIGGGEWAVSLFLIMSGFLMAASHLDNYEKINSKEYLKKKIIKFVPLNMTMILIALPIAIATSSANIGVQPAKVWFVKFFLDIFMIETWVPVYKYWSDINISAWYLTLYIFNILMFKYIMKLFANLKVKVIACSVILLYALQIIFSWKVGTKILYTYGNYPYVWFLYRFPFIRLIDFAIGCGVGCAFRKIGKKNANEILCNILECLTWGIVLFEIYMYPTGIIPVWYRNACLFVPTNIILVVLCARQKSIISGLLSKKVFVWLGNLVMYAFLIHHVIIDYLNYLNVNVSQINLNHWIIFIICVVLSFWMAYLYKKIIERKLQYVK